MKLLVIGASGYVGSRLVKDLSSQGHEIVAAVHSAEGARALDFSGQVLIGDVRDDSYLQSLLACGCEGLLYLASLNYQQFGDDPGALLGVKVEPFWRLLSLGSAGAASSSGLRRAIYFSTQQVYGAFGSLTLESVAARPISSYGLAHRLGEDVAASFHRSSSMSVCSLRLANVVGAAGCVRPSFSRFAVNDMCEQALSSGSIVLRSISSRDFVSMADVVAAVSLLLASDKSLLFDGVFNIGSGVVRSTSEVAELVARLSGRDVGVTCSTTSAESVGVANDISRLLGLGFTSVMGLEEAIGETFALMRGFG